MAQRACVWIPARLPSWAQKFVEERRETDAPTHWSHSTQIGRNEPTTTRRVVYILIDETQLRRVMRRRQKAAKKARLAPRVAEQRRAIEARRAARVA